MRVVPPRPPDPTDTGVQQRAADARPNFLLITLDDAARRDFAYMPHVRRLVGDAGATMTTMIAPTPVCVPSRASVITGEYAHNHGMLTVGGTYGGADRFVARGEQDSTVATWLDDAGYDTFVTGKWMNGYERALPASAAQPGWDCWTPATLGTYRFFDTRFFAPGGRLTGVPGRYSSDQITDRATTWIAERAADPDPWFGWINYVAPHNGGPRGPDDPPGLASTVPAPRDVDSFPRLRMPRDPNLWRRAGLFGDVRTPPRLRRAEEQLFRERVQALQAVDRGVRDQIRALRVTGQLDRTYVVVTSDNGYTTGQQNWLGKIVPYRDILTVPTVVRGPRIPRGSVVTSAAAVPDLPVTFATLAGAPPEADDADGADISGLWEGRVAGVRPIPIEGWPKNSDVRRFEGVVVGRYRYAVRPNGTDQLFDVRTDPFETVNLAAGAGSDSPLVVRLRELTAAYVDCVGTGCPRTYALGLPFAVPPTEQPTERPTPP
ncbi:sulfatase-like hydrolase/transferase [Nocardioides sp.]|uniref:sulfatase-like hydrolase/transferase n=1 Tax=Nocardioides sp. TaxID=35761 RepID=UPI0035115A7D